MTPSSFKRRPNRPANHGQKPGFSVFFQAGAVALATLFGSLTLWRAMQTQQRERLDRLYQRAAQSAASRLAAELQRRDAILRTLARSPRIRGDISAKQHNIVDTYFAVGMPGLTLLVRNHDLVSLVDKLEEHVALTEAPISAFRKNLSAIVEQAEKQPRTIQSTVAPLTDGDSGLVEIVASQGEDAGVQYIASLSRCHPLFYQALQGVAAGFDITVVHDQTPVYRRGVGESGADVPVADVPVDRAGARWRVRLSPSAEWAAAHTSSFATIVLGAGTTLSFGLAGAVFLLAASRQRHRRLLDDYDRAAEQKRRFELACQGGVDGLWDWRPGDGELWWTGRSIEALGYSRQAPYERIERFLERIHPEDVKKVRKAAQRGLKQGEKFDIEFRFRTDAGEHRWLRARGQAQWNASRRPVRISGAVQDVTERKKAEQNLREHNERLSRKNQELEEFTYTISHDLKSPLVTILGFADHLANDLRADRLDQLLDHVEYISQAANRMKSNVDDLLELSRIGRVSDRFGPVDLNQVGVELLDEFTSQARRKGASLIVESDLPIVRADRQRVLQILRNLVSNAIKHGCADSDPHAEVRLGARQAGEMVNIFVKDTGPGIAREHHERIFELFHSLSRAPGSTGVGLALVRRVAEAQGGHVWVESEPGAGAVFWVSLPAQCPATQQSDDPTSTHEARAA